MTNLSPEQQDATTAELTSLRAQNDEDAALIAYLRNRTVILNNEIRQRDAAISARDQSIAHLTEQLAEVRSVEGERANGTTASSGA